jgi:hypothetical protein
VASATKRVFGVKRRYRRVVLRLFARGLTVSVAAMCGVAAASLCAAALEFPPADFNILDAKTSQVVGYVRYSIGAIDDGGLQTVSGDERYLNGEHDAEREVLQNRGPDKLPLMVTFEHDFYNSDGTIARVATADFRSGEASCTVYNDGHPTVLRDTLDFPSDTYAGAVMALPLQENLRKGLSGAIHLHTFNCVPGPKVIKVAAYPQAPAPWEHYAGETVQVAIKPDFGWLNLVVAPFMPEFQAWFNPSDQWQFVGARFSRFYKGPEIVLTYAPGAAGGKAPAPMAPRPPQLEQARQAASVAALRDDSGGVAQTPPAP